MRPALLAALAVAGGAAFLGLTSKETIPRDVVVPAVVDGCRDVDLRPNAENAARVADATLCLLNAQRAKAGLRPLGPVKALRFAAEGHALDMAKRKYFEHDSPEGVKPWQRILNAGYPRATVGENLAWGELHESTPARIVDGWMHSPGHRENILRASYSDIGIGFAFQAPDAASTRQAAIYVTTFGSLSLSAVPSNR